MVRETDRPSEVAGVSGFQLVAVPSKRDGTPVNPLPRQERRFPEQLDSLESGGACIGFHDFDPSLHPENKKEP